MTKRASVHRLRDISKQRSIRRPLLAQPELGLTEAQDDPLPNEEWPIGK
jgi:hypothetical protein